MSCFHSGSEEAHEGTIGTPSSSTGGPMVGWWGRWALHVLSASFVETLCVPDVWPWDRARKEHNHISLSPVILAL